MVPVMEQSSQNCRLERRKGAIVAAARDLFIKNGFEQTTLAEIVNRSGGSLSTVYKLFGNKDGLLEAVVLKNAASGEAIVRDAMEAGLAPGPTLHQVADGLQKFFLHPDVVAIVRIVIGRSVSDPRFARRFFERTANRTRDAMRELFARWQEAGYSMQGTPDFLADQFMSLFSTDLQRQAFSYGVIGTTSREMIAARTDFFLKAAEILPP